MTTARAQPLLADSELTKTHDLLFEAHMLVTGVRSLFFGSDDFATAARLKDIQGRLADEFHAVERLIAASEPAAAAQNAGRQRDLVAEQFLEQQALHIADRDRPMKELSEVPPSL